MSTTTRLRLNPTQEILLKRCLNKDGKAQAFFTKEVEKRMNKYVPYLTGNLKDFDKKIKKSQIIYKAPYAKLQFYTNKGLGREGTSLGGLRGKRWDKRMWIKEGNETVKSVAKFVGGRSK